MRRLLPAAVSLGVLALLVSFASSATAQTCRGTADINSTTRSYFGGSFAFPKNQTDYAALIGGGGDAGFAVASVGGSTDDSINQTAFVAGLSAGAQIKTPGKQRAVICPTGVFQYLTVRDLENTGVNATDLFMGGGASVGFVVVDTPSVQVVPVVYFDYGRERIKLGNLITNQMNGTIAIGAGIIHGNFAVAPAILVPIGDGSELQSAFFRIDLTIAFGK